MINVITQCTKYGENVSHAFGIHKSTFAWFYLWKLSVKLIKRKRWFGGKEKCLESLPLKPFFFLMAEVQIVFFWWVAIFVHWYRVLNMSLKCGPTCLLLDIWHCFPWNCFSGYLDIGYCNGLNLLCQSIPWPLQSRHSICNEKLAKSVTLA